MTDASTKLSLPFLAASQAQKHVTVNEALLRLDALVQLAVAAATIAAQPAGPADGTLYILPPGKTGADWSAMANGALAYWRDGAWEEITPRRGWRAFDESSGALLVYDDGAWRSLADATLPSQRDAGQFSGFRNRLINGAFAVNQRVAPSIADDTYCLDRWYVLTQAGNVAVSQLSDPETGAPHGLRITQAQASAQRVAIAQIVESAQCRDLRATLAVLSGRVRRSDGGNVRCAILEWTGAVDAVTSDVINDWASAAYAPGGFFLGGVSVVAAGEVSCVANTWRGLAPISGAVGASANNLVVIAWSEATMVQNATLDLNRLQLEPGAVATPFEHRPRDVERMLCQRYCRVLGSGGAGRVIAPTTVVVGAGFDVPMRTGPSFTPIVTAVDMRINGAGTVTSSGATFPNKAADASGWWAQIDGYTGLTAGDAAHIRQPAWALLEAEL